MLRWAVLLLLAGLMQCRKPEDPGSCTTVCDPEMELIFQTGFEPTTTGIPAAEIAYFTGTDLSLPPPNDWEAFNDHPQIGTFSIQYQGGDTTQRHARLVAGPVTAGNTVLQFWLSRPNVEGIKGRVQANVYDNRCLKEFYQSVRLYLDADFAVLQDTAATFSWLTLFEYWNNGNWTEEGYPFRITVNLQKANPAAGTPLVPGVHGQIYDGSGWQNVWEYVRDDWPVPLARWLTIEIFLKEGGSTSGRFYMKITPEGGAPETVFDIVHYTHHPDDPCPDGFTHVNPMKLYTSAAILGYMERRGKALRVYWDDFRLWRNRQP